MEDSNKDIKQLRKQAQDKANEENIAVVLYQDMATDELGIAPEMEYNDPVFHGKEYDAYHGKDSVDTLIPSHWGE